MNVAFLDFWKTCQVQNHGILPGFNPRKNFFACALKRVFENVNIVDDPFDADTIVYSCFGKDHLNFPKGSGVKKVFFTGENIRPNFNECDWAFSHDFDTYGGRNFRLPMWYYVIDWFDVGGYDNPGWLIPTAYLNRENPYSLRGPRTKNYCIAFNNSVPNRFAMMEKLRSRGKIVEQWGIHSGNWFQGEDIKLNIFSQFRFNICFENSVFAGYNTERLIQAKIGGCVPLYWGSKKVDVDFNPKAYLNLEDFPSLDAYVDRVIEIESDPAQWQQMRDQPLFLTIPTVDAMLVNIKTAFGS